MLVHDTRIEERENGRPPVKIKGYHTFYKPKDNMCHGLITIVRNRFPAEELVTPRPGTHSDLLTVKIWINNQPLVLHNLYRTKNDIDLVKLLDAPTPAFVGTDINAQHLLWSSRSNTAGRRIMKQFEELREYVILNSNQEPTTIYDSAIDITILHARLAARSHWEVMNDLVSDHYGIYTAIYLKDIPPKEPQLKWRLCKADWPAFYDKVNLLISKYENIEDLNIMAHDMNNILIEAANDHIPKTSSHRIQRMYWCYDPEVKSAKRQLNNATKHFRKSKNVYNKRVMQEAAEHYASLCNTVKNNYWNEWITDANNCVSAKQLWQKIKKATGTAQRSPKHPNPKAESNRILNEFINRSSSDQLTQQNNKEITDNITNAMEHHSLIDIHITTQEINTVIKGAKNTAPGEDTISYTMIKHAPQSYIAALADLYSASLLSGKLPLVWKKAKIIPIPKKTKNTYRPISLLPIQSKIMEKVMLNRISWTATPPDIRAMGFKKASGTRDAISTLIHDLTECRATRNRNKAAAVFLDLKQAFELVNKNTVLSELCNAGLTGKTLQWCDDFLSNRKAVLTFQNSQSEEMEFENGTPQGSTLSPMFFNYAMNKFLKLQLPQRVKIITYADDIVLYCDTHHNPQRQLQEALDMMSTTANKSGFLFAPAKTKSMWFFGVTPSSKLHLDNADIEWVKKHNYLGVIIDCKLRFHKHAEYIAARASSAANALKVVAQLSGVNCSVLRRLFNATVKPILDYGSEIHNLMSKTQQERLERVQNAALRSCLGVPKWTATHNVRAELNILPVSTRSEIAQAKYTTKVLRNQQHPLHIYIDAEVTSPYHSKKHQHSWIAKTVATYQKLKYHTEAQPPLEQHGTKCAPWDKVPLNLNFNESIPTKDTQDSQTLKTMAMATLQPADRPVFYTDGSVQDMKAGIGIAHNGIISSLRLNNNATILQAELAAIREALKMANENNLYTALIVTDSKSAMAVLNATTPKDNIKLIKDIHTRASQLRYIPEIIWVPAHVGIPGNEQADTAAKTALTNSNIDIQIHTSISQQYTRIKKTAIDIQHALAHHNPSPSVERHQELVMTEAEQREMWKLPRHIQRDISKLRTYTRTRMQITNGYDTCHYCDYPFSSYTEHYLTDCPVNRRYRESLITGNIHHMTNTRSKVTAILQDQARQGHKNITKLLQRFPISQ